MPPSIERDRLCNAVDRRLDETIDLLQRLVAEPSTEGSVAISRCFDLVTEAVTPLATALDRPAHDGLESLIARFDPSIPSLNVTRIDAGAAMTALNVIPDTVTLGVDRRRLPGENPDAAIVAIRTVVDDLVRLPFSAEIVPLRTWPPHAIAAAEPIAVAARDAVGQAGRPGHLGMDSAANASSCLDRVGIPTVLLGPGIPEAAHTTGESVAIAEIRDAVEIYTRIAVALSIKGRI